MNDNFLKGIIKENPVFVSLLALCPALGITTTVENAIGMGILVITLLIFTNATISLMKNFIPKEVKIPAYIVIIATFVTMISYLTQAFFPVLFDTLGIFIPLIVVNCIVLGRAEAFASKNKVLPSIVDGIGIGIGFLMALVVIGFFREFLATGGLTFGVALPFLPEMSFTPFAAYGIELFAMPAGSFLTLGVILAVISYYQNSKAEKIAALLKAEREAKA